MILGNALCILFCAQNHAIRRISARAFRENSIVFQSMDQVKRCDGLMLLKEHSELYFLLHDFGVQIIPFKLENLKKKFRKKNRDAAKNVPGARYPLMQIITLKTTTQGTF